MAERCLVLAIGMLCWLQGRPARAQVGVERVEQQVEQIRRDIRDQVIHDVPLDRRTLVDYGGYLSLSYLSFDDQGNNNHAYRGYDLVGYARVNLDQAQEFYLRARMTYRDYNPGDSFAAEPDHLEGHLEEGYYELDLNRQLALSGAKPLSGNVNLQIGRQFETWADGLVLSQYVDGVTATFEQGAFSLRVLACITAQDLTVDFDSSRANFYKNTRRAFYGGMLSLQRGAHCPYIYGLVQQDENSDEPLVVGPVRTAHHYDSYYIGAGVTGGLSDRTSYGIEAVYEGGQSLSASIDPDTLRPVGQREEPIHAWATEAHLDYLPGDARRSRLGAGLILASGDSDRRNASNTIGGNRPGTDDTAFNALGYLPAGLAFLPTVSNLIVLRGTASTYPLGAQAGTLQQLQVGMDLFVFGKLRTRGGIDEPTADKRYLGLEPDLFVNWQLADDVTVVVRYGAFFPGAAEPSSRPRQFFYGGVTYAF